MVAFNFVNRESELAEFRALLGEGTPQFIRVYGRRRLGKTALLTKLVRERGGIYLIAYEGEERVQVDSLLQQLGEATGRPLPPGAGWSTLWDELSRLTGRWVVIDEFQNLTSRGLLVASQVQHRWDSVWKRQGPSLILCGSSVGMMRSLTEGRRGPLFGRLTADLRLRPFSYSAVRQIYRGMPEEEMVHRFAVFGRSPFYHEFSFGSDLPTAIRRAFLERTAALREEPRQLLALELDAPARYQAILDAIGRGARALHDIASTLGVPAGALTRPLRRLEEDLDLLRIEAPVLGKARRAHYVFADAFFAFYYRFVYPNLPAIELEEVEEVERRIRAGLDSHVGHVFEEVVREALLLPELRRRIGTTEGFEKVGKWWNRTGEEIDVVAASQGEAWVGEVKWSSRRGDLSLVRGLERKIALIEGLDGRRVRPFVACRAGCEAEAVAELEQRGGFSLDLKEIGALFERSGSPPQGAGAPRGPRTGE